MKSAIGCFLVLGALPLIVYPFVLTADIMGLVGTRSSHDSVILILLSYAFYIGTMIYPLVYLVFAGLTIVAGRKQSNTTLGFAFGPVGYLLLLVALAVVWSFSEPGIARLEDLQTQGNAAQLIKCASSMQVNGGDDLSTTGCGALEIGKTATGVIADTSQAHNWEFKVEGNPVYATRFTITVKSDAKSCPTIRIVDSAGKIAQGFEEPKPPMCLDGMITTSFFSFNPSANGTYITRVSSPKTPGAYSLKIEPK